eukprot:631013-Pelagomonas_calceolata.AAC.3
MSAGQLSSRAAHVRKWNCRSRNVSTAVGLTLSTSIAAIGLTLNTLIPASALMATVLSLSTSIAAIGLALNTFITASALTASALTLSTSFAASALTASALSKHLHLICKKYSPASRNPHLIGARFKLMMMEDASWCGCCMRSFQQAKSACSPVVRC